MPIENFGEAMLRGMGWEKGAAIGRGGGGPVEAVEFVRRDHRLGLGAQPAPKEAKVGTVTGACLVGRPRGGGRVCAA